VRTASVVAVDQRRRLLEALPRAVAENGFEGTTVEDIVKLAQVRRSAFYEQFGDKRECFAAAYEIAHERLLGVLTLRCYMQTGMTARIGAALKAGLELLASDPALARLVFIEAPAAGEEVIGRHHEWLDRYGRMLRLAAVGSPDVGLPSVALEPAIVGGVVSRIRQKILAGETRELAAMCPELVRFTLSFYCPAEQASDPSSAAAQRDGAESAQPQSPDRSPALESA
jgi:AcrR family transcriptional regulator